MQGRRRRRKPSSSRVSWCAHGRIRRTVSSGPAGSPSWSPPAPHAAFARPCMCPQLRPAAAGLAPPPAPLHEPTGGSDYTAAFAYRCCYVIICGFIRAGLNCCACRCWSCCAGIGRGSGCWLLARHRHWRRLLCCRRRRKNLHGRRCLWHELLRCWPSSSSSAHACTRRLQWCCRAAPFTTGVAGTSCTS